MDFEFASIEDRRRFVEAKNSRKQTEADAQLLSNRISLLKQEETRTLKKVEETRKKAQEILAARIKSLQKSKERALTQEAARQSSLRQNLINKQKKQNNETNKEIKKHQRLDLVKRAVSVVRQARKENEEIIDAQKNESLMHNSYISNKVRNSRQNIEINKERIEIQKKERARRIFEERLMHEEMIRGGVAREMNAIEEQQFSLLEQLHTH